MDDRYFILEFNKIHVIESLRENDVKTGQNLYRDYLRFQPERLEGFRVQLQLDVVSTKAEFEDAFTKISAEAGPSPYPIVHLEAHGDKAGIELTSGETVDWFWFREVLTEINIRTRFNLLLTLGSCEGAFLTQIAVPPHRAPFLGLIAPLVKLSAAEVEASFPAFYQELLTSFHLTSAFQRMNSESDGVPFNYSLSNAREIFVRGFTAFRDLYSSAEALDERARDFIERARQSQGPYRYLLNSEQRQIYLREIESGAESRFERFKQSYFMKDIFPENEQRFGLREIVGEV